MSAQTPTEPEDRASSGIPGLDDILGGTGFPRNQMYLVEGNPGAGKTTLGLHFLMEGVRRGEKVAYVVLAESEKALHRLARSHGWDLDNVIVIESADQSGNEDQYSLFHPSEIELGEASDTILGEIDQAARVGLSRRLPRLHDRPWWHRGVPAPDRQRARPRPQQLHPVRAGHLLERRPGARLAVRRRPRPRHQHADPRTRRRR